MEILIFAPALVCIAGLVRWGVQKTFLNICLPVLIVLPTYFVWKVDGFPGLDFGLSVLLPLGVAMLALCARWRFSRSDVWMLGYIVSCVVADLRVGETSLAKYRLFNVIVAALVPYAAGKLLIEQAGMRIATGRKIIFALCLSCVVALPESVIRINLFERIGMHLFPDQWPGWFTQIRWGLGRVAGPFGTAEIYGMILIVGIIVLLWAGKWHPEELQLPRFRWLSPRKTFWMALLLMGATLLMTQSRGPWIGMLIALPIALVGRAKRIKRAALLLGLLYGMIGVPAYIATDRYASGPRSEVGSQRETAQFRRQMNDTYLPIAEKGGMWGWGSLHPVANGSPSIDNEYLRVFLIQGYAGVATYILLMLEAGYVLVRMGWSFEPGEDRHFCFTMLAIVAGWSFTLCTVYMGAQSYEFFFLLMGWTQAISLAPRRGIERKRSPVEDQKEAAQMVRVYT